MIFKYVYKRAGEHVHVNAFAGSRQFALAKAGVLCYNWREWNAFMAAHDKNPNFVFEEQITSGPATRGNNGYRQDLA